MSALLDNTLTASETVGTSDIGVFNWQDEVAFKEAVPVITRITNSRQNEVTDITIILTGSTGFLGQHILRQLIPNPLIKIIHCIAVHNALKSPSWIIEFPKVTVHPGDLCDPNLRLPASTTQQIFTSSTATTKIVVIHNGADINFLR